MTTLTLTIKDESKAVDVVRFLRDIPFLEVCATSTETPPLTQLAVAQQRPHFGCARGEIVLSGDFDDSLDDFAEYM